ncbi:stage III sporulation protein AG [Alkalibacillus flavidus]|uniref:Stage III sporulation protein AG n=1 Tax=Alkalibacillus flavidus TaxID=546021 RepID=A0ABV2KXI9_9BACI
MNFLERLKLKTDTDRPTKRSYVMLIGLIGLLLLIVSNVFSNDSSGPTPPSQEEAWTSDKQSEQSGDTDDQKIKSLQDDIRTNLEQALESVAGVHEVEVSLQLDSSAIHVYEKNETTTYQYTDEEDQNGGIREVEDESIDEQTVLMRENNREEPLLVQTKTPPIRGVLIVAKGVDQIHIKERVIDSVSRLLDVSTHRIAVMPKGEEE